MKELSIIITLITSMFFFSSKPVKQDVMYYTKSEVDSLLRERDKKIDSLLLTIQKNRINFASKKVPILNKLSSWSGPEYKITSLLRNDPSSQHYRGEAVDLAYNDSLVLYLLSEEGKKFLEENNLSFYIESNKKCNRWQKWKEVESAQPYLKIIPWATGLHIHIYMKRDDKRKANKRLKGIEKVSDQ